LNASKRAIALAEWRDATPLVSTQDFSSRAHFAWRIIALTQSPLLESASDEQTGMRCKQVVVVVAGQVSAAQPVIPGRSWDQVLSGCADVARFN
jgi:hypothetical protein